MAIRDPEQGSLPPSGRLDTTSSHQAAQMVENALHYCETKTPYHGHDRLAAALRTENPQVHDYFRHSLARQLAQYLKSLDDGVVCIYTHSYGDAEEEGEDRSVSLASNLNLILHVRRKTAALDSVLLSIDQALLAEYRHLVAPYGEKMVSLLDVQTVDDSDVEECVGFAVMLRSTYNRPIRVWPE